MSWKKKILLTREQKEIEERIKAFEEKTGAELVVSILRGADPYPAATLRFAILSTFFTAIFASMYLKFDQEVILIVLLAPVFIIYTLLGRLTYFKKICFSNKEIDREVEEKSIELFHSLGLSDTKKQVTILLLVSLQEKRIELLIDKVLKEKINKDELEEIVSLISGEFKNQNFESGFIKSIDYLEGKVLEFFPDKVTNDKTNELPEKLVWLDFT